MTYGFALLTAGTLLVYSGWSNSTIADVLKGLAVRKGGAGDTGFISMLSAPAQGVGEAVTPRSGGTGPSVGGGKLPVGITTFDGKPCAKWVAAELRWARRHGWTGTLSSGYRSKQDQERVCATGVKPCATPGTSNHEGKRYPKGAADVTEEAQLDQVLSRKRGRKLKWTGPSVNDNVHFSSGLNGV